MRHKHFRNRHRHGFTLIELVMVIVMVGILSTVAVPFFTDMRTDAKNAAVKEALVNFRSAIAIAHAAILLKEAITTPPYPAWIEMANNQILSTDDYQGWPAPSLHPVLAGTSIVAGAPNWHPPFNPWSTSIYSNQVKQDVTDWCHNSGLGKFQTPGPLCTPIPSNQSTLVRMYSYVIFDCSGGCGDPADPDNCPLTRAQWFTYMGDEYYEPPPDSGGWCYNQYSGDFFAASANNGGITGKTTEANF